MNACYYPGEWPEAEITASPTEYAAMADRIAELIRAGAGEVVFPAARPGLASLTVRVGSGPVLIEVREGGLSVTGGPEAIMLFGRNMPTEPTPPPRYHIHFEYAGREEHVAAGSIPLVMQVGSVRPVSPPNWANDATCLPASPGWSETRGVR